MCRWTQGEAKLPVKELPPPDKGSKEAVLDDPDRKESSSDSVSETQQEAPEAAHVHIGVSSGRLSSEKVPIVQQQQPSSTLSAG
jgi:hypothetical protein